MSKTYVFQFTSEPTANMHGTIAGLGSTGQIDIEAKSVQEARDKVKNEQPDNEEFTFDHKLVLVDG